MEQILKVFGDFLAFTCRQIAKSCRDSKCIDSLSRSGLTKTSNSPDLIVWTQVFTKGECNLASWPRHENFLARQHAWIFSQPQCQRFPSGRGRVIFRPGERKNPKVLQPPRGLVVVFLRIVCLDVGTSVVMMLRRHGYGRNWCGDWRRDWSRDWCFVLVVTSWCRIYR